MESYTLTRQDAADLVEISVRSIDRYIKSGKIRSQKRGKSVYVNDNDVKNINSSSDSKPIIITTSSEKKENINKFETKEISTKENLDNFDKITKTFENIYTDLRNQIEKKDKIIQELSVNVGISQERVTQSISVSEHNRSQMLLEESKTHIAKQMTKLSDEKQKIEKDLKDERFDKKILIIFVFIFLSLAAYFWFKTV
ncbi:MAG: helix-turn-helix domain-containing protein [Candidatus Gracilibacteria bacterium]|nr:helix-turn-helix domain-containing protein [Candidatus Gracilibacteria bacterium]MDQ7022738.1 helix-turn-helix domain-containing protein [Candidatus Gracilibacteria bacterium]